MKFRLLFLSLILTDPALAQPSDCLIDSILPSFETVMGYELAIADDGTEFTPQEKAAFNQVAAVVPTFYREMKSLQRFERIPNGYVLEGGATGEYFARGWRFGGVNKIRGQILLAQDEIKTEKGRFTGEFYFNIVHEMTHALDQLQNNYSDRDEWTGLSTWGADGMGTSKNFVTWYAPARPSEDFAESMTYFILNPDELLAKAPKKFEMIANNFFNGKRFDSKTLLARYETELLGLQPAARAEKIRELRRSDYYACKLLSAM